MADILGEQSRTSVVLRKAGEPAEDLPGIQVFGAATDWDLSDIGRQLGPKGVRLPAGCAGFAAVVTDLLALEDAVLQRDPVAGKELPHCGHRERKYSPDAAVGGRVAGVSAAEVGSGGSVRVQRQLLPPVFQRAHGHHPQHLHQPAQDLPCQGADAVRGAQRHPGLPAAGLPEHPLLQPPGQELTVLTPMEHTGRVKDNHPINLVHNENMPPGEFELPARSLLEEDPEQQLKGAG